MFQIFRKRADDEIEKLKAELDEAYAQLDEVVDQNAALLKGYGLLEQQAQLNYRNALVLIGCLVTNMGGKAFIAKDVGEMISNSLFDIDMNTDESGTMVTLVETKEPEGESCD